MASLARWYRTVRHIPLRQLSRRLYLKGRRTWRVRHADRYRDRLASPSFPVYALRTPLPQPLFPDRSALAREEDTTCTLTFLNESWTFPFGAFDWRPTDLQYGTRLWLLNLHYMEFLEGLSDEAFTTIVDDWIAHAPPYQSKYWLDTWNSFAVSTRCVVWLQQYARRGERLPDAFRERMLKSVVRQLRFLTEHLETDIGGNHLIRNIKALLWGGRFWDSDEATEWQDLGQQLLAQELDTQILGDGMHYERSPAYHVQVFADLLECYSVLEEGPLKGRLGDRLSDMAQVTAHLIHPDGQVSLFNDGGLEMARDPEMCLQVWEELSGEDVRSSETFALSDSGYYGLRRGDEYVLVDAGKIAPDELPGHGHGDVFSFEWTIDAQRVVVDAGVYEYNPGQRRVYSRSTQAHNTVTVDGEDQCEFWDAFRMGRRARVTEKNYQKSETGFRLSGRHDGYRHLAGCPVHERTFDVESEDIRVEDEVKGGGGQRVEARLLLHPECSVEMATEDIEISCGDINVVLETNATVSLRDAVWFPNFGVERSCKQIILRYGEAPCSGGFRLVRRS